MSQAGAKELGTRPLWDMVDWKQYLKPQSTAMLVIDPQNDILKENGNMSYYGVWKRADRSVPAIIRAVEAAHKASVPVFWVRYYRPSNGKDVFPGTIASLRMIEQRKRVPDIFQEGSWDIDIIDELKAHIGENDYLLDKSASGCFEGTNLDKYLRQMGVRDLLICGYLTDFCVANTARASYDKGYGTIVIGDACDTRDDGFHQQTLDQHNWYFGPVIQSDDVAGLLKV